MSELLLTQLRLLFGLLAHGQESFLQEKIRAASALFPNTFLVELPHRSAVEDDVRNWARTCVSTRLA